MRIRYTLAACAGLSVLMGCDKDVSGTDTQLQPAAIIRYVNAVNDTSPLDFRFVDGSIEGSPQYANVLFRTFTPYQRARAGERRIRIFTNPNLYANAAAVAAQQHLDTTFTFEANARYTIISYGQSRTGSAVRHRLVIIRDELPTTLTATQVGVRAIHAAPAAGNVDLYVRTSETPAAIAGAPALANVAPGAASAYLPLAARPVGGVPALTYRFDITAPGSTTAIALANSVASGLLGVPGTPAQNPLVGFQVGRTAITAIVFPASVVGSRAPATLTTASILFLPDRALDSTEP